MSHSPITRPSWWNWRRPLALTVALVALVAVIAGCGSSKKSSSTPAAPAAPSSTPSTTAAPSGGTIVDVKMQNIQFSPKTVTAKVGEIVRWTNDDSVAHNVVASTFKSSDFEQGGTYTQRMTKVGTITYKCTLHPGMDGTIKVTK
jgi:plastocyanin